MEILTLKDVMSLLGCGRPTATRIIKQSGKALGRRKGQKLLISRQALE